MAEGAAGAQCQHHPHPGLTSEHAPCSSTFGWDLGLPVQILGGLSSERAHGWGIAAPRGDWTEDQAGSLLRAITALGTCMDVASTQEQTQGPDVETGKGAQWAGVVCRAVDGSSLLSGGWEEAPVLSWSLEIKLFQKAVPPPSQPANKQTCLAHSSCDSEVRESL